MAENREFPSLNDNTQPIFNEFARIYKEDIIENGRKEVEKICAQYKSQEKDIGRERNQPQIER